MTNRVTNPDLVFWQNTISLHQAPLLRELSTSLGLRVLLVTADGVGQNRAGLGWESADYGTTEIITSDSLDQWKSIADSTHDAKAHIFSGLGSYPLVDSTRERISRAARRGHIAVFSESWDNRGLKGMVRFYRGSARVKSSIQGIDTVLAAGNLAYRQFRAFGVPPNKLMKFGYSVVPTTPRIRDNIHDSSAFQIIFVGSLTSRKDPQLLIQTLSMMTELPWHLTIIGKGPLDQALKAQASKKGISTRLSFSGQLDQKATRERLAQSDLLVLPSRYDGWGSVVNEALMSGVRAVVSDAAGASEIIVSERQGAVFRRRSPAHLERALRSLLNQNPLSDHRETLQTWAEASISPAAFAAHLMSRIEAPETIPQPPWLRGSNLSST